MSSKLVSEFNSIQKIFELYSKLVSLYDDWVIEYNQRIDLDLRDITHGYDETFVRNVRKKDEKFCHICPEICENELQWSNLIRDRLEVLKNRIKYVHDLERILQLRLKRFREILNSSPSSDEVENCKDLLNELGPVPVITTSKKTKSFMNLYLSAFL